MAVRRLQDLRELLNTFKPDDLIVFGHQNEAWLSHLRNVDLNCVVKEICSAVEAAQEETESLRRRAWIRCRLVPLGDMRIWWFYRLKEAPTQDYCHTVLERMASQLRLLENDTSGAPHAWTVSGSAFIACLMTDAGKRCRERYAVYLAMWTTKPLMAMHTASRIHGLVIKALRSEFGNDFMKPVDYHRGDLESGLEHIVSIMSQCTAREQGMLRPDDDQQLEAPLAKGSQYQQHSFHPSATDRTRPNVIAEQGQSCAVQHGLDFSQAAVNQHGRRELPALLKSTRKDGNCYAEACTSQPAKPISGNEETAFKPANTCTGCFESFTDALPYHEHMKECPEILKIFCYYCGLRFAEYDSLQDHLLKHCKYYKH